MNTNFHYYCVKALALKAGFPEAEAETIAYASEYTDHSTEHKWITIDGMPDLSGFEEHGDMMKVKGDRPSFDPVCTAHEGRNWFTTLMKWGEFYTKDKVQRVVLMPFHFLPPEPHRVGVDFQFPVQPNSTLARELVRLAMESLSAAKDGMQQRYGLAALGIALHTYADTFAHCGFSGRQSSRENNISDVEEFVEGRWQGAGFSAEMLSRIAPEIGHSEAGTYPDQGARVWRFKYAKRADHSWQQRDNPTQFLEAARSIYAMLSACSPGSPVEFGDFQQELGLCIQTGPAEWGTFLGPAVPLHFDPFTWRNASLEGDSVTWDNFSEQHEFDRLRFTAKDDPIWFLFHLAARRQRNRIESSLPPVKSKPQRKPGEG